MEINLMDYVVEQALVLIPALYIIGLMLKTSKKVPDWLIPFILLLFGIIGSIALMGININAIIQGILVTGVTVYTNQLFKQVTEKKDIDKEE